MLLDTIRKDMYQLVTKCLLPTLYSNCIVVWPWFEEEVCKDDITRIEMDVRNAEDVNQMPYIRLNTK